MAGNRKSKAKLAAARKAAKSRSSKVRYAGKDFKVSVSRRKIRNQTRYCVQTDGNKPAKGFKGKGSTKRFHGCFIKPGDAAARKAELSK
jgi:hypothetical protein